MKKKLVILMILANVVWIISGCAKREPDSSVASGSLELESIDVVSQANGSHVERVFGEEPMQLSINADVIIPSEIKTGSVVVGYPAVSKIEEALCTEPMEEVGENEWAIKADGQDYAYEQYYHQTDDFASYYNAQLKVSVEEGSPMEEASAMDEKQLSEQADAILSALGYSAERFHAERYGDTLVCFYSPALRDTPIVSKTVGFGGTQLTMKEGGLAELRLEKTVVESDLQDTEILPLDAALDRMELLCESQQIPLLLETDEIRYIRLAYYVDEQLNLLPVWCFSTYFANWENAVYCMNAVTGDMVFDFSSDFVPGEGEEK